MQMMHIIKQHHRLKVTVPTLQCKRLCIMRSLKQKIKIYIRSASCISPQETFNGQLFSSNANEYNTDFLNAIEPDYKTILDVKQMRRMSRIVRIGLAAAISALHEAGKENADAII